MKDEINLTLLMHIAKNAAKKTFPRSTNLQEELQQDLMLHVLERPERYKAYIATDSPLPLRERENKLFVSLIRVAAQFARKGMAVYKHEQGPLTVDTNKQNVFIPTEDDADNSIAIHLHRIPYGHPYQQMTEVEVLSLLPFILLQDNEVPEDVREKVAIVRNAVYGSTKPQQQVIVRLASGMSYEEIGEDLGIVPTAAHKRYKRALLHERCDFPTFIGKSQKYIN